MHLFLDITTCLWFFYYQQACAKRSHAGIVLLSVPKMGFSPAGAKRCPDKFPR